MASQYEFIIIGGGTAGLVLANQLSHDPNIHVLVLKAGENLINDPKIKVPGTVGANFGGPNDWGFKTTPQSPKTDKSALNQGKALNHSSAINLIMYIPPSKTIIDAWETLGNAGWGWDAIKSYFAKPFSIKRVSNQIKSNSS